MRFSPLSNSRQWRLPGTALCGALALFLAGCGGGGGSNGGPSSPTPTPTGTPGPTATPTSPASTIPDFVFASSRGGSQNIYLAQNNVQAVTRLTEGAGVDSNPSLSPDGLNVVFSTTRDGNAEIYHYALTGPEPRLLPYTADKGDFPPTDVTPTYSPTGNTIAWVTNRGGAAGTVGSNIWLMDATGDNQRQLTTLGGVSSPAWSPNGSRIVFVSSTANTSSLRFVDVNSKVVSAPILTRSDIINSPSFNSAGTKIVFGTSPRTTGASSISVLDLSSNVATAIPGTSTGSNPTWSRGNDLILYSATANGTSQLFVVPSTGGTAPRQVTTQGNNYQPSFRG